MFCLECGSPLREDDETCRACGSPAPGAVKSHDIVFEHTESPKADTDENADFQWNLSGFPSPRKTEEINFVWGTEDAVKPDEIKAAAHANSKTASSYNEPKPDPMEELNKFFSFEKANEDFQKLLDRQYEKTKGHHPLPEPRKFSDIVLPSDNLANESPLSGQATETLSDSEAMPDKPEAGEPKPEIPAQTIPAQTIPVSNARHEYNIDTSDDEDEPEVIWVDKLRKEEEPEPETPETPESHETPELPEDLEDSNAFTLDPISLFQDENIFSGDRQARSGLRQNEIRLAKEMEQAPADDKQTMPKVVPMVIIQDTEPGLESGDKPEADNESEVEAAVVIPTAADHFNLPEQTDSISQPEQTDSISQPEQSEQLNQPEHIDKKADLQPQPLWFETDEKGADEKKGGGGAIRAVLIVIILILLAEASILGIQLFFPNSSMAGKAGQINSAITTSLNGLKDWAVGFFEGTVGEKQEEPGEETGADGQPSEGGDGAADPDSEGPDSEMPPPEPNTVPQADKNILVGDVAYFNKGIVTIKGNNDLLWKQGRDYGITAINNSKPLEDNYWYTDDNNTYIYYDKEIAATIIKFDSLWTEYVNGGSKDVISLTKKDSKARKNAETFSKVGKVEQTFLTLEIGEIRRDKEAFYVWTYEEIKEVQGSSTSVKKYNWIYCLEPVDGEMKIVNYYKY
ncbi:hypothetical protein MASR2M70_12130 [Bacillota bacterium]